MTATQKMTKGTSKAGSRAKRGGRKKLPGKRHPGGKLVQPTQSERAEDAQRPMLEARCRQRKIAPTRENLDKMKAQRNGCKAGQAIDRANISDNAKDDLFGAVLHIRKTCVEFDRAIGAPNRHAKVAAILAPPDRNEADAASPPRDERSDEERQRQATSAMMAVEGWLGHADNASMHAVKLHCLDEPDLDVRDVEGLLLGLHCILDGIAGRKIAVRSRA